MTAATDVVFSVFLDLGMSGAYQTYEFRSTLLFLVYAQCAEHRNIQTNIETMK